MLDKDDIWNRWIDEIKKKFSPRNGKEHKSYSHFSYPFSKIEEIQVKKSYLNDPLKITNHDFFPLLSFFQKTPVFQKRTKTNPKLIRKKWKQRPLMYANHLDSLIYSWYSYQLGYLYEQKLKEKGLEKVVSAYRQDSEKRTNVSIAKEMFDFLDCRDPKESWDILLFDVEKFYDTLIPNLLKERWASLFGGKLLSDDHYAVFRSIVGYGVVFKGEMYRFFNNHYKSKYKRSHGKVCSSDDFHLLRINKIIYSKGDFLKKISPIIDPENPNRFFELVDKKPGEIYYKGIPQGLPISPTLANIYMLEFDDIINRAVNLVGGVYRRYADDIIVSCPSGETDKLRDLILKAMKDPIIAGLNIQDKKTQHYRLLNNNIALVGGDGDKLAFTYLGLTYSKNGGRIKSGTIARFYQRVHKIIKSNLGKISHRRKYLSKEFLLQKALSGGTHNYLRLCVNTLKKDNLFMQIRKSKIRKIISNAYYGRAIIFRVRRLIEEKIEDKTVTILNKKAFKLEYGEKRKKTRRATGR